MPANNANSQLKAPATRSAKTKASVMVDGSEVAVDGALNISRAGESTTNQSAVAPKKGGERSGKSNNSAQTVPALLEKQLIKNARMQHDEVTVPASLEIHPAQIESECNTTLRDNETNINLTSRVEQSLVSNIPETPEDSELPGISAETDPVPGFEHTKKGVMGTEVPCIASSMLNAEMTETSENLNTPQSVSDIGGDSGQNVIQGTNDQFYSMSDLTSDESFDKDWADYPVDDSSVDEEDERAGMSPGSAITAITVKKQQRVRKSQSVRNKSNSLEDSTQQPSSVVETAQPAVPDFVDDSGSEVTLKMIYQTMVAHRSDTKTEIAHTQATCKKVQNAVQRITKICTDMSVRVSEAESRISTIEDKIISQKRELSIIKEQRDDVSYKLSELENQSRRNNLRVLGVPENLGGSDVRKCICELFSAAFPDLVSWDWSVAIERAHRPTRVTFELDNGIDQPP